MKLKIFISELLILGVFFFTACGTEAPPEEFYTSNETGFYPAYPEAGDSVWVKYNPEGSPLEGIEDIDLVVYQFSEDPLFAKSYRMSPKNGLLTASFQLADTAYGAIFKFYNSSEDITDNNTYEGYMTAVHKNGKEIKQYSPALGYAYYQWGRSGGLDRDVEKAYNMLKEAVNSSPELKDEFLGKYITVAERYLGDGKHDEVKSVLDELDKKAVKTQDDYEILAAYAGKYYGADKESEIFEMIETEYPESSVIERKKYMDFYGEKDLDKKTELAKSFKDKYPESGYLTNVYSIMFREMIKAGKLAEAAQMLKENKMDAHPYTIADASASYFDKGDYKISEETALLGIDVVEEKINQPGEYIGSTQTEEEFKIYYNNIKGMCQWNLARVKKTTGGSVEEIASLLESAAGFTMAYYPDPQINKYYMEFLLEENNYAKALEFSSELIKDGESDEIMTGFYKQAFVGANGSSDGYEQALKQLKMAANAGMLEELERSLISLDAPQFTLTNLDGNVVSLSDYKGKKVVVDFWATWCGPCIRSFPGVAAAVDKFDDVEFLFVNTWENVENKTENAREFIDKNGYDFHVLMDLDNAVITDYKVAGIPTKFILDSKGKIRFKKVGYGGNNEEMIRELELMFGMID